MVYNQKKLKMLNSLIFCQNPTGPKNTLRQQEPVRMGSKTLSEIQLKPVPAQHYSATLMILAQAPKKELDSYNPTEKLMNYWSQNHRKSQLHVAMFRFCASFPRCSSTNQLEMYLLCWHWAKGLWRGVAWYAEAGGHGNHSPLGTPKADGFD